MKSQSWTMVALAVVFGGLVVVSAVFSSLPKESGQKPSRQNSPLQTANLPSKVQAPVEGGWADYLRRNYGDNPFMDAPGTPLGNVATASSQSENWWEVAPVAVCNTEGLGAYLRRAPGGEPIVARPEGWPLELLSTRLAKGEAAMVRDSEGNEGWISSDYLCYPFDEPIGASPPGMPTESASVIPVQKPAPESPASTPSIAREAARVVRVIDGDTIDVIIGDRSERVRYYGSDAPERGEKCYPESTAYNTELVGGQTVYLEPDARERDPYGRLLRYVFVEGGAPIDGLLIAEGYARAWTRDGKYRGWLMEAESQARRRGVGCLWR